MAPISLPLPTRPNVLGRAIRSKPLLLCFSHLRWDFVYQRPQHLLGRAAQSFDVIVFEEPVFDADKPFLEWAERPGGVSLAIPHLPAGLGEREGWAAQRKLVDLLIETRGPPVVVWHYGPMSLAFSAHLAPRVRVYDCMDELAAFKGAPALLPLMERRLFAKADLVFTGGKSLFEAKKHQHPNVHAFPSSIDCAHFARSRRLAGQGGEPADQAEIAGPRLGYFGVIDERMDTGLVAEMARLRPDWQFVLIGPVVKIDPAELPRGPNLHWLGRKSYEELPDYLAGWNVGFMPFALNEATRYISPTKTPEFLAAGLPVVSTPITDVVHPYGDKGLVGIAASASGMIDAATAAMAMDRAAWRKEVDAHLSGLSWDRTWASMARLIRGAARERARLAAAQRRAAATPVGREALHV